MDGGSMRIALGIEYDGAPFCGWQTQIEGCGIQNHLELALNQVAGVDIKVTAAGRTDAGVHALSQIVHFDTEVFRENLAWVQGTNAFLSPAIRVLWAAPVDDTFHARFSAIGRHYQFVLCNRLVANAIMDKKVGWIPYPLALEPMQEAMHYLKGEHDFSAFRAAECQASSPIRRLDEVSVMQQDDYFIFSFSGNAFLQHQVRNMMGALVLIGRGHQRPDFIEFLLSTKDRKLSPATFPPQGLYLTGVDYETNWAIPCSRRYIQLIG
jgi:tRNA pseudouridine38-40 synthase